MENDNLSPSVRREGRYDKEFNESVVAQCKELIRTESYSDWYLFVDLVTRSLDKLDTNTIGKLLDLLDNYPGHLGKQEREISPNVRALILGLYTSYMHSKDKTVIEFPNCGFKAILRHYQIMRFYIRGDYYAKSDK
jgi:hypothetical protein